MRGEALRDTMGGRARARGLRLAAALVLAGAVSLAAAAASAFAVVVTLPSGEAVGVLPLAGAALANRAAAPQGVAPVEGPDVPEGDAQVLLVLGLVLGRRVGEVGQQGEAQLRVGVGQVVDLEPVGQHRAALGPHQHGGHDHEGGAVGRDALLEITPRYLITKDNALLRFR